MRTVHLTEVFLIVVLTTKVILATIPAKAAPPRITPLHAKAEFSRSSSAKEWSASVLTPEGRRAYKLFFEPEYDVNRALAGVDLVLSDLQNRGSKKNLLSPPRNWHGLQPYNFVASDLLQGPDKSTFTSHRTMKIDNRGIVVQIDVLNVSLSSLPGGDHQIDEVQLSVTVNNANP